MNKLVNAFLVGLMFLSQTVFADVWAEREALEKIRTELAALESLVIDAKKRSDTNSRTTFDYNVLLDDLRKIQAGISHHLTVPMEPIAPSTIDALNSNYTEHQK